MTLNPKNIDLTWFLAIFGCKKVNYDEVHGDKLRLPENRNCYRLSRVSWALLKLLVMIGLNCMSVLICNYFHARQADSDIITSFRGRVSFFSSFGRTPTHRHKILSRNTEDSKPSMVKTRSLVSHVGYMTLCY